MGYCKDCTFRNAENRKGNKSSCVCPKLTDDSYDSDEYNADDSLVYSYDEGGVFYVGDKFGCIHWMPKK